MVQIVGKSQHSKSTSYCSSSSSWKTNLPVYCVVSIAFLLLLRIYDIDNTHNNDLSAADDYTNHQHRNLNNNHKKPKSIVSFLTRDTYTSAITFVKKQKAKETPSCPVSSISQLTKDQIRPQQGKRHMVTPPKGGLVHLVCCQSTKGPLNIMVHEQWAPLGAKRFLDMVHRGYFTAAKVPFFRCIKGFLCQFGLSSDPKLSQTFQDTILDDIKWLPKGPNFKHNKQGVKRFARGYLAYAGSEENTRSNQFIVSLDNVEELGGGSPWEVPFGELVGDHSFETLSKLYTHYGEEGPSQHQLTKYGVSKKTQDKYPKMDYITSCTVVDQLVQVSTSSNKR